jgi:hypothetical protein
MAKKQQIYLLHACDEWKSYDSFRLIMASTDDQKIRKELYRRIRNKSMDSELKKEEIFSYTLNRIHSSITYGSITSVDDGERVRD